MEKEGVRAVDKEEIQMMNSGYIHFFVSIKLRNCKLGDLTGTTD